jgi:hypothetical protein
MSQLGADGLSGVNLGRSSITNTSTTDIALSRLPTLTGNTRQLVQQSTDSTSSSFMYEPSSALAALPTQKVNALGTAESVSQITPQATAATSSSNSSGIDQSGRTQNVLVTRAEHRGPRICDQLTPAQWDLLEAHHNSLPAEQRGPSPRLLRFSQAEVPRFFSSEDGSGGIKPYAFKVYELLSSEQ